MVAHFSLLRMILVRFRKWCQSFMVFATAAAAFYVRGCNKVQFHRKESPAQCFYWGTFDKAGKSLAICKLPSLISLPSVFPEIENIPE